MENYNIYIKPSAAKELEMIPDNDKRKYIIEKIRQLSSVVRPKGVNKLVGRNHYRLKFDNCKVIYDISDETFSIHIFKIGILKKEKD